MRNGQEQSAKNLLAGNPDVRKYLNPNTSYGEHHGHNTALHFAVKFCMVDMTELLLNTYSGNPNKRNVFNETAMHCLAQQYGVCTRTYSR